MSTSLKGTNIKIPHYPNLPLPTTISRDPFCITIGSTNNITTQTQTLNTANSHSQQLLSVCFPFMPKILALKTRGNLLLKNESLPSSNITGVASSGKISTLTLQGLLKPLPNLASLSKIVSKDHEKDFSRLEWTRK